MLNLVRSCESGWHITVTNGLMYVTDTPIAFEASFIPGCDVQVGRVDACELNILILHILWIMFAGSPQVMASFVQNEYYTHGQAGVWSLVYSNVAWLIVPPGAIATAMNVGRPDLQVFVQRAYMAWLLKAKSPMHIQDALEMLCSEPIEYDTCSTAWRDAAGWIESSGSIAIAPRGTTLGGCIVSTKATRASIALNGHDAFILSHRDIVLLILRHLWDPSSNWVAGLPACAPKQFHALSVKQPWLFSETGAGARILFDELPYLQARARGGGGND
tara:strand:- start:4684 stop:5505 length:822 start_codon:yes stop_codon:yes gene_type:complete